MKCPDCGNDLEKTAVAGFDESFRCGHCRGVWMTGWVMNRIAEKPEEKFTIERNGIMGATGGNNCCPTDGSKLYTPGGEEIPSQVLIQKCNKCDWWWLPDDQIFELQKAYLLRQDYMQTWSAKPRWQTMVWPAIISLILTVGLVGSVSLVVQRQQASIGATVGIRNWQVTNLGNGEATVTFNSGLSVSGLQYKSGREQEWREAGVECKGDLCSAKLAGLAGGEQYAVRILGKEYSFMVK